MFKCWCGHRRHRRCMRVGLWLVDVARARRALARRLTLTDVLTNKSEQCRGQHFEQSRAEAGFFLFCPQHSSPRSRPGRGAGHHKRHELAIADGSQRPPLLALTALCCENGGRRATRTRCMMKSPGVPASARFPAQVGPFAQESGGCASPGPPPGTRPRPAAPRRAPTCPAAAR